MLIFLLLAVLLFPLKIQSSCAHIKLLEANSSHQANLFMSSPNFEVEEMVVDLVDDPNSSFQGVNVMCLHAHPILSPYQWKSMAWLNQLPIKKEVVEQVLVPQ